MTRPKIYMVKGITAFAFLAGAVAHAQKTESCSVRDLKGGYGFTVSGTNNSGGHYVLTGRFDADGKGSFTGFGRENANYHAGQTDFTGTYTVNSDCTGNAKFRYAAGGEADLYFILVADGNELIIMDSTSTVMETGYAKKQTLAKNKL